jgi:hypothetical protein
VAWNDPPMFSLNVNTTARAPARKLTERVAFPIGGGGGSGSASLPSNPNPKLPPPPLKTTTNPFAHQIFPEILPPHAEHMRTLRTPDDDDAAPPK